MITIKLKNDDLFSLRGMLRIYVVENIYGTYEKTRKQAKRFLRLLGGR